MIDKPCRTKSLAQFNSDKKTTHQYLTYRKKPKQFCLETCTAREKTKNDNPLYSTESLAKYFYLPSTDISLTMNYLATTESKANANAQRHNKSIMAFNQLQEKMRSFQRNGSHQLKKKFQLFDQFSELINDHLGKVQDSTMFKETEEFPGIDLKIMRNLKDRESILRENKFKTSTVDKWKKTQQVYSQNIEEYLRKDQQWRRYGYTLEVDDDSKLIEQSWERRNKLLRYTSKICNKKYKSPQLKSLIDKDILTYTRAYMMSKRSKTVS